MEVLLLAFSLVSNIERLSESVCLTLNVIIFMLFQLVDQILSVVLGKMPLKGWNVFTQSAHAYERVQNPHDDFSSQAE